MADSELPNKATIMAIKRNVLRIVEELLQDKNKEWVLENCVQLCQADYDDVIEERSIEHMCGYPLCSKPIKMVARQKYRIDLSVNKVFDIEQRKNFCSNECYKASNFLKNQLHTLPLYLRKPSETTLSLTVLSDSDNKGSAGEELVFHRSISEDEIEDKTVKISVSTNLNSMLQEDIKDCAEHLADLEIKEKVYSDKYVFLAEDGEKTLEEETGHDDLELSGSETSDTDDKKLFPEYDNPKPMSDIYMPVSDNMKKAVLINPIRVTKVSKSHPSKLPIEFISKVFSDWFTEDTMKYLLGERQVYSIKADQLFKTLVSTPTNAEELDSIKNEYVNLCIKIDKLPDEEEEEEEDLPEGFPKFPKIETNRSRYGGGYGSEGDRIVKCYNFAPADVKPVPIKKNPAKRKNRKSPNKSKSVSLDSDLKSGDATAKILSEEPDPTTLPEPTIPLVDSLSQKEPDSATLPEPTILLVDPLSQNGPDSATLPEPTKPLVDSLSQKKSDSTTLREPTMPLVDSLSPNSLRRQVLMGKFKKAYLDVLSIIELHYRFIKEEVTAVVDTFSLTPTNVVYKPQQMKCIAIVLFRMKSIGKLRLNYSKTSINRQFLSSSIKNSLTRIKLKELNDDSQFVQLCENTLKELNISHQEVDTLAMDLVSPNQVLRLLKS